MIESLEQLRGRVAVLAQVKPAVKALIEGLVEKVNDFKGDVNALRAFTTELRAKQEMLANAVVENTMVEDEEETIEPDAEAE